MEKTYPHLIAGIIVMLFTFMLTGCTSARINIGVDKNGQIIYTGGQGSVNPERSQNIRVAQARANVAVEESKTLLIAEGKLQTAMINNDEKEMDRWTARKVNTARASVALMPTANIRYVINDTPYPGKITSGELYGVRVYPYRTPPVDIIINVPAGEYCFDIKDTRRNRTFTVCREISTSTKNIVLKKVTY